MSRGRLVRAAAPAAIVLLCGAMRAAAQDTSVVFVHGFNSSGSTWADTAARLHDELGVAAYTPDLSWTQPFDTQARQLQNQFGSLDRPVAVGHSNGGIVSRAWSRTETLGGLVTYGAPHLGAPLIQNAGDYLFFNTFMSAAFGNLYRAFGTIADCTDENPDCDLTWLFALRGGSLTLLDALRSYAADLVFSSVGLFGTVAPVAYEMTPGSPYLNELNSSANLSRESSSVPVRVGIVSVADNYYSGGVIRAAFPDHGELVLLRDVVAIGLEGDALDILSNAYATPYQINIAYTLENVAEFLLFGMDEWWCDTVSEGAGRIGCWENDTVVPTWSQDYAGFAPGVWPLRAPTGPAHIQEVRFEHSEPIQKALVDLVRIPPLADGGGSSTGGCSDRGDSLCGGQELRPGARVVSSNGAFFLTYQSDGNLVRYRSDGTPTWATNCWPGCDDVGQAGVTRMQTDGNFVVYDSNSTPRWWSGTDRHPGAYLRLSDDGSMTIFGPSGETLWRLDPAAPAAGGGTSGGVDGGGACPGGANVLCGDQPLRPGERIVSPGGGFFLIYQDDGNLVRYRADGTPTWAINCWPDCTDVGAPGEAILQADGNFVAYDAAWVPRWWSGTDGHSGAYLVLDDAGVMTIYGPDGSILWRLE